MRGQGTATSERFYLSGEIDVEQTVEKGIHRNENQGATVAERRAEARDLRKRP